MKKGFTLVELLAVITVLGVLMILVVPSVIKTMDGSKQKAYDLTMVTIKSAAQEYVSDNRVSIDELKVIGGEFYLTLLDLNITGYIETPIINPLTGNVFDSSKIIIKVRKELENNLSYTVVEFTKETCFTFDSGTETITGYNASDPSCPKDVIIPNAINGVKVKVIGSSAFYSKSLTNVMLPDTLVEIGVSAFRNNSLMSIRIPDSVTNIKILAFSENYTLKFMYIGKSLATLPYITEAGVVRITPEEILADGTIASLLSTNRTIIGRSTGSNYGLKIVVDPANLNFKSINNNVYTKNGQWLVFGVNLQNIVQGTLGIAASAFAYQQNAGSCIIPNTVQFINEDAFAYVKDLNTISIPNSVEYIGQRAFMGNHFTSVTIGSGITDVRNQAFKKDPLFLGTPIITVNKFESNVKYFKLSFPSFENANVTFAT